MVICNCGEECIEIENYGYFCEECESPIIPSICKEVNDLKKRLCEMEDLVKDLTREISAIGFRQSV